MAHFSPIARKSLFTYTRNLLKSTYTRSTSITTQSTRQFSNNNNDSDDNDNDNSTFISDNWSDPSQRSIKSVEELSEYGKTLLCGSLFTGTNKKENTEEIYGEWAENYEHDMGTLRFDSLATMPGKVEQYLTETLINNIIPDEETQMKMNKPDDDSNANILDVGCGTGLLGELLMENTDIKPTESNIDGMDLTQEMLDILCKERGDLYNEVYQHDIQECPWPFESDKYDLSVCNGVLVYVKDSECLDEFIRVTKPGGYCLLMLRQDTLDQFSHKIYQLITDKKWQIAEITNTRYNFKAEVDNEKKYFVPYNHHIFTVL